MNKFFLFPESGMSMEERSICIAIFNKSGSISQFGDGSLQGREL
jgi:hypothetical protein